MQLGIYGGTFDPIHYGHLINAEFAREYLSLDEIIFVPSQKPVHKRLDSDIKPKDRFKMIELAIQGNKKFRASRFELESQQPSYTIYTVKYFQNIYPQAELFYLLGEDAFEKIETWKEFENILGAVNLVVLKRDPQKNINQISGHGKNKKKIIFVSSPIIEISSSAIRRKRKSNKSIKYLVPDVVDKYIAEKGLYSG